MLHGVFARRLPRLLLAAAALVVGVAAVLLVALRPIDPAGDADPARNGTVASPAERATPTGPPTGASPAPRSALGTLLATAANRADALAALGEARSRDLPALIGGQGALRENLDQIDALLRETPNADAHADAIARYRTGAADTRAAMEQGQAAVLRFDWNAVASASRLMRRGADELAGAAAALP